MGPPIDVSRTDEDYLIHFEYLPHIKDYCQSRSGRVLDIGCGDQPYRTLFDGVDYHGIDLDLGTGVTSDTVQGDATKLPFSDQSFDAVLATQVLEHLPDPDAFWSELYRVLKPNGTALVTTNMAWHLHEAPHDYLRYTRYGLQEYAAKHGFTITSSTEITGFWRYLCIEVIQRCTSQLPVIGGPATLALNLVGEHLGTGSREFYTVELIYVTRS